MTQTSNRPLATVLAVLVMASCWMATLSGPAAQTRSGDTLVALSASTSTPIMM